MPAMSTPIPNADVATTTLVRPSVKSSWMRRRLARQKAVQLFALGAIAPAANHGKGQRRPVETCDRDKRILEVERDGDICPHLGRRRRGEPCHRWPAASHDCRGQETVVGAKVVSPR